MALGLSAGQVFWLVIGSGQRLAIIAGGTDMSP